MRRPYTTAFLAGLTSLAFELVLVRLLAFFLTATMDFLAIPLALLGLALGSMYAHFGYRGDLGQLASRTSAAVLPVVTTSLLLLFAVFDLFFSDVHVVLGGAARDAGRLVVYSVILLPPFAVFGALFAALFAAHPGHLGRLYAADLAGAATGCLVAPVLLTVSGLPAALGGILLGALLLLLLSEERARRVQVGAGVLFVLAVVGLASGRVFREHPDPRALAHVVMPRDQSKFEVREMMVRWNEIARTAVVQIDREGPGGRSYYVIQDNGLSNVSLPRVDPKRQLPTHHTLAWDLGRDPRKILVVFAGAGRELQNFDQRSEGRADITGVELNAAVVSLATSPRLEGLGIGAFLQKPNVHLVVQEGRDFLNHDQGTYDLIHAANNGAVASSRTGHTRKFLDTREAMAAYLDHLAPDGLLVFSNQPIAEKITSFRELFAERGLGEFEQAAFVWGKRNQPDLYSLVVAPGGFDADDLAKMEELFGAREVVYAPAVEGRRGRGTLDAIDTDRRVTDDRPFARPLGWSELRPFPTKQQLNNRVYVSSWVKVFTVVLFAGLSGLAGLAVLGLGAGSARVPARWVAYLLLTGIGYMCVEIGLIARTELLVGNPLYAVALNLAVFLVSSAAGSYTSGNPRGGAATLAGITVLAVGWGLVATGLATQHGLSLPLPLKAVLVALAVGPAGAALGTFYPYAVSRLVAADRGHAVPATYALTTLSSVLGSALAMTAIIDLGFVRVILIGAAAYVLAGALEALTRGR